MLMITDRQIQEDVLRRLRSSEQLCEKSIGVNVSDYVVTLTGAVESTAAALTAHEEALLVAGVHTLVNKIDVRPPANTRTDQEIEQEVARVLEWDTLIPHERIHAAVSNGWVALEGSVRSIRERDDAERIVGRLVGVRGVYNQITVESPEYNPENVREAIEIELKRRAERKARCINAELIDGKITLTGTVHSWDEERAVISAAGNAAGVGCIQDKLTVDPYGHYRPNSPVTFAKTFTH